MKTPYIIQADDRFDGVEDSIRAGRTITINRNVIEEFEHRDQFTTYVNGYLVSCEYLEAIELMFRLSEAEQEYHKLLNNRWAGKDVDVDRMRELQLVIADIRSKGRFR